MVFIPFLFSLALLIRGLNVYKSEKSSSHCINIKVVCVWSTFHQQLVNAFVCTFFVNKIVWRAGIYFSAQKVLIVLYLNVNPLSNFF